MGKIARIRWITSRIHAILPGIMAHPHRHVLKLLHRAAVSTEEAVDGWRRKASAKVGWDEPRQIVAYRGYADTEQIHLSGRVLSNAPRGGPLDDDGWWDNLLNTWRRWESDELAGVPVTMRCGEEELELTTDAEGYYHANFPAPDTRPGEQQWLTATARAEGVESLHEILVPSSDATCGIISDMDDTVLHTGITSILLAAKLTFLENAKTRKPLEGVAALYQALQRGHASVPVNPIFYISSSPWNLHDLLVDFLRLNEIPRGPLMLRDLGLDRTKFLKEKGHGHKKEKALRLIDAYPGLLFILIGDSGQEDPSIYAEVCKLRPGRIKAVYIRDIDPDEETERDTMAHHAVVIAGSHGVPMILAPDSLAISEHARGLGLIPADVVRDVAVEVAADRGRPETGEQALEDAISSLAEGDSRGE